MSDTRDRRAIEQIACPHCGAAKGQQCRFRTSPGRIACCQERRMANQARLNATESIQISSTEKS